MAEMTNDQKRLSGILGLVTGSKVQLDWLDVKLLEMLIELDLPEGTRGTIRGLRKTVRDLRTTHENIAGSCELALKR